MHAYVYVYVYVPMDLLSKGLRPHAAGPLSLEMRLRSGEVARCIGELRLSSGEVAMASGGFPGAPQAPEAKIVPNVAF